MPICKCLLFVYNIILGVAGVLITIVGAGVLVFTNDFKFFLDGKLLIPAKILIVAGVIVLLIAIIGCCGAFRESFWMLILFAILLSILFVIEMAVGLGAKAALKETEKTMRTKLNKSMKVYPTSVEDHGAWDVLQKKIQCCGIDSPKDWFTLFQNQVPASCCAKSSLPDPSKVGKMSQSTPPIPNSPNNSTGLPNTTGLPNQVPALLCKYSKSNNIVYQDGCYKKLKDIINIAVLVIMGVGIGVAVFELAGIIITVLFLVLIKMRRSSP